MKNDSVRMISYNIPCIRNQIAHRRLTFIGKVLLWEGSHILMRLITSWCDNPRRRGRLLFTNKMSLVCNFQLILPNVDDASSIATWDFHALDRAQWLGLVATLEHPASSAPDTPPVPPDCDGVSSSSSSPLLLLLLLDNLLHRHPFHHRHDLRISELRVAEEHWVSWRVMVDHITFPRILQHLRLGHPREIIFLPPSLLVETDIMKRAA